jgi:hypothetical protein
VNQTEPLATAVLVSLPGEGVPIPSILGKILPVRQVEYAAARGCSKVILLGRGAVSDAIAIRHAAEGAGLRLVEVSGPHALATSVAEDESLLVLQNNLLPAWKEWATAAAERGSILILPAKAGRHAGFERIDLARAWAGALVIPGKHLPSLHELPEDAEAAPALLRIALQARLPELLLDEAVLSDGSWSAVTSDADLALLEDQWLARHAKPSATTSGSDLIAGLILKKSGHFLFSHARLPLVLLSLSHIFAMGGAGASFYGQPVAGFGLLALAAFLHSLALVSRRLREIPFVHPSHWPKTQFLLDIAFMVTAFLSLGGSLATRIFLPFVLLAAFHSAPTVQSGWRAKICDRALVFALVGLAAIFLGAQSALMLVSAALLVLNLLSRHGRKG